MESLENEELMALQDAAGRGDAAAQATLGLAHELGHGVARDVLYAGYLYRQAALAGEPRAQFALGQLYELGVGIEASVDRALPWYSRAAEQGHDEARRRLDQLKLAAPAHAVNAGAPPAGHAQELAMAPPASVRIGRTP